MGVRYANIRHVGIDPKSRMEISFVLPSIVIRVWNASFGSRNGDQRRGRVGESLSVCEPSVEHCLRPRQEKPSLTLVPAGFAGNRGYTWSVGSLKKNRPQQPVVRRRLP